MIGVSTFDQGNMFTDSDGKCSNRSANILFAGQVGDQIHNMFGRTSAKMFNGMNTMGYGGFNLIIIII